MYSTFHPEDPKDPEDPEDPEDPGDPEDPKDPEGPEDPRDPEDPKDPEDPEDQDQLLTAAVASSKQVILEKEERAWRIPTSHKHVSLSQHLLPEWTGDEDKDAIDEEPRKRPSECHREENLCV